MTEARPWLPHALHALVAALIVLAFSSAGITTEVMTANGWWTPFFVVNAGILVGNLFAATLTRAPDQANVIIAQGRREDLVDSHRTIVEQLRNLDAERNKLSEADYQREREALLAVGASALRELETGISPTGGPPMAAESPFASLVARLRAEREADPAAFQAALEQLGVQTNAGTSGEWRGAGYTVALILLAGLLFWMAGEGSRPRGANDTMTGGDVTGEMGAPMAGPGGAAGAAPEDPRYTAAKKAAEAAPNDLEAQNKLTAAAIASQDMPAAMAANQKALEINPNNPDARTYNAVLKAFIGRKDEALTQLQEIAASNPTYAAAWVYQGLLQLDEAPAAALVAFEKAAALDPNPEIAQMVAVARQRASGAPPAPPAETPPAAGGDELLAEGTLTLADAARADGKTTTFVYLRAPGGGGPPFAALKLPPGPFPQPFRITRANLIPMMAGRPLPPELVVAARLDIDGNATTKDPSEPAAEVPLSAVGATGLTLPLQ
jgi:tetratricopeptide (TPR) repeat protein